MRKMRCDIRVDNFIIFPYHVILKPYFFTISFDDWQNLQWRLGLVWLWRQKQVCGAQNLDTRLVTVGHNCCVIVGHDCCRVNVAAE